MRLMSEKGKESQQDRYVRIKKDGIESFEQEMCKANVPEKMKKILHKHCDVYYGCCAIQEQMMVLLMECANFTLAEANAARKIIAKKVISKIPELKEKVFSQFENHNIAEYFWELAVAPQLGYAFNLSHSLPYSFVGIQSIFLATQFNPIYWNTACLIVNSGATDSENGGQTDYDKISKAMGDILNRNIKISLPNVNTSNYGFKPDAENNQIIYGLKAMLNVGDDVIERTIANRPYVSPRDYINRVNPNKQAMVSLIKGGAFDSFMDRKQCMAWYLWDSCDKKKKITLQNMANLIKYSLLPENTEERVLARRVYEFNRYLKAICDFDKNEENYHLDNRAYSFLNKEFPEILDGDLLNKKTWNDCYQTWMDVIRIWIAEEQDNILINLNSEIFKTEWNKYAQGNYSSWEMEALCFYFHEHELKNVNRQKYGIVDFSQLPEEPIVEKTFTRKNITIPIYKLSKICGTCIAKNKIKSTVVLLTTSGVVSVKFRKEYFALFDKQISEKDVNGIKHVKERSWFNRGSMIVVMGIRRGDDFIAKKYASSIGHQLYKIDKVNKDRTISLRNERYKGIEEEDNSYV